MMNGLQRRRRSAVIAIVGLCAIGAGIAVAEDVWVDRPVAKILGGKGSLYPVVAEVHQGDKLSVVERDGSWVHVQFNGNDGWVFDKSLSAREVGGDVFAGANNTQSAGASSANAAKGFTEMDFAASKNLSVAPLQKMEAEIGAEVTPDGLEKFMADGKVGDAKVSN
jgi:hypothetical protein